MKSVAESMGKIAYFVYYLRFVDFFAYFFSYVVDFYLLLMICIIKLFWPNFESDAESDANFVLFCRFLSIVDDIIVILSYFDLILNLMLIRLGL